MKKILMAVLLVVLSVCAYGQEQRPLTPLEDLNVDFMLHGYFFAKTGTRNSPTPDDFGPSLNRAKPIPAEMPVRYSVLSLVARPDEETVFAGKYKGLKVLLVNGTNERLTFAAQDSRLDIVQEAQNEWGLWKPVEYLPSSWCGNSYHVVFLGPKEYWEFAAARYTGKFKTRLRFRLDIQKSDTETLSIYSNEFDGSINPKQFTVTQASRPWGLVDPFQNLR